MRTIGVNLAKPYNIVCIEKINDFNKVNFSFSPYKKVLIITDDIVKALYIDKVIPQIKHDSIYCFAFNNGEQSKTFETANKIINFMIENNFHRNDLIVALGGGVVGDISGFVASIFMRGIDFIQIPTTLLAAVDASIGGKTAVDIPLGKNLIGTFYQPKVVIIINEIIHELKEDIFNEGMSEVIKYGAIYDQSIWSLIEDGARKNIDEIVYKSALAKADIVSKDERESNLRQILNFGHTFAHAIEKCSEYKIPHGEAVAYGMIFESYLGGKLGYISSEFITKIQKLVSIFYTLEPLPFSMLKLIDSMKADKKNIDSKIVFIFPTGKENKIIALEKEMIIEAFK